MIYWNRDYIDVSSIAGVSRWFYSVKNASSYETRSSTVIRFTDSDGYQINEVLFNMLYFLYDGIYLEITDDKTGIAFSFKYLDNQNIWQDLIIVDGTSGMLNSGEITWEFPEDFNYYEDFPLKMEITSPPAESGNIFLKYRIMTNIYAGDDDYLERILSDATTQSENFLVINKGYEKRYEIKYGLLTSNNIHLFIMGTYNNKETINFTDGKYKGIFHGIDLSTSDKELSPMQVSSYYYSEIELNYGLNIDLSAQNRLYLYDSSYLSNIKFNSYLQIFVNYRNNGITKFSNINSFYTFLDVSNDVIISNSNIDVPILRQLNFFNMLNTGYFKLNNCNIFTQILSPSYSSLSICFENIDFIIDGEYAVGMGYSGGNYLYTLGLKDVNIINDLSLYEIKREYAFTNNNLSSVITISNSIKVKVTDKSGVELSGVSVNIKDRFGIDNGFIGVPLLQNHNGRLILKDDIPVIRVDYNNFMINDIVFFHNCGIGRCIDVDSNYSYFQPIHWSIPINSITTFFLENISVGNISIYSLYKLNNSIATNINGITEDIILPCHYLYRYKPSIYSESFEVSEASLFPFTITLSKFGYETQTIIYNNPKPNDELTIVMSEGGGGISIVPDRIATNRIGGKRNV